MVINIKPMLIYYVGSHSSGSQPLHSPILYAKQGLTDTSLKSWIGRSWNRTQERTISRRALKPSANRKAHCSTKCDRGP